MQFGLISLLLVQIGFIGASVLLYARMRSKADAENTSRIPWGIQVQGAIGTAEAAKRQVELIEVEHYKTLKSFFENQSLQISQLKSELLEAHKRIDALEIKVQTLQRMDRHDRKKMMEESLGTNLESDPMADAVAKGFAFELPRNGTEPVKKQPMRTFGAIP